MTEQHVQKRSINFFIFTTAMLWFSLYAYIPELSTYANTLGASYRMIGVITASYGLTQLLLRIPLGIVSDLMGKRKIFIVLGLVISVISSSVTFFFPSGISLLVTRSLAGVTASTWVIFTVMFSSYFKKEEATKSVGLMHSYNAIGQLMAMVIGGAISYWFGTRYLFLLAAVGGVAGLIASFSIHEGPLTIKKSTMKEYLEVATHPQLVTVSIMGILSQLITFATAFGFVPILAKNLGANSLQLSLLTILAIVPAIIISRLAGDFFPRHFGRKNTIRLGFIISGLLCVVMPWLQSLSLLYIAQFISGIGRSLVFPLLMGLGIEDFEQEKRATAMGVYQAAYGIGMVLGPISLGFIAQSYGLFVAFGVTGVFGLVGLIMTQFKIK